VIEYTVQVFDNGDKKWFINGRLHREDGPAIEHASGSKSWFINGNRHRDDGPAIEYASGEKRWYINGRLHRLDGPAIEYAGGAKSWYTNGQLNRVDGPAVEYANGEKHWYVDGRLHRVDGPAIEYARGDKYWFVDGVKVSEAEHAELIKPESEALSWTPGPWYIEHAKNQHATGMVKDEHGAHFANVFSCEVEHKTCELIALAPEMAEAILAHTISGQRAGKPSLLDVAKKLRLMRNQ